jgi:hypothetical protein
MKLLAIMRPRARADVQQEIASYAESELRMLWTLYQHGTVREMYSPAGPGAVLVLEADSLDEAQRAVSELPLLSREIMTLELVELLPFTALRLLFAESRQSPPASGRHPC